MLWDLEWGKHIRMLLARQRRGLPTPALDRRPKPAPLTQWLYDAFVQLCDSRTFVPMGGFAPLPVSEIRAWLDIHGIDDQEERLLVLRTMQAMDQAWLKKANTPDGNPKSSD